MTGKYLAVNVRSRLWPLLGSLIAGAVLPLSLAPFNWWLLGIVPVAALYLLLDQCSARLAFWRSFAFGLGLFTVGASWVYVSIHVYGHASPFLAALLTAVFVLTLAAAFALPFLIYAWLQRMQPGLPLLLFPSIWVLGEWFRGWLLTGFPWLYLGYSHTDTWLSGWAPLTGVLGLSWLGALLAVALAEAWRRGLRPRPLVVTLAAILIPAIGGWLLQKIHWTEAKGEPLQVAMIQPAIPLEHKWDSEGLSAILEKLLTQTAPYWRNDLVIWPESAIPRLRHYVGPYFDYLDQLAQSHSTAFLTGVPTRDGQHIYNSVVALGKASGAYHKRHLVPFGEYVPLEHWLRGTIEFFDLPMSAFSSGPADQPGIEAAGHAIGTLICYEIVFPDLTAATARDSQLLLTVSNDTWFGASIGPHQHLQMARMRTIETAKPLLRATNDGITAAVNYRGRIVAQLPQFAPGVLETAITPRTGTTFFSLAGSTPVLLFCFLCLLQHGWLVRRAGHNRSISGVFSGWSRAGDTGRPDHHL